MHFVHADNIALVAREIKAGQSEKSLGHALSEKLKEIFGIKCIDDGELITQLEELGVRCMALKAGTDDHLLVKPSDHSYTN